MSKVQEMILAKEALEREIRNEQKEVINGLIKKIRESDLYHPSGEMLYEIQQALEEYRRNFL
jgi:hypothetical protein